MSVSLEEMSLEEGDAVPAEKTFDAENEGPEPGSSSRAVELSAVKLIAGGDLQKADEILRGVKNEYYGAAVHFAVVNILRLILSGDKKMLEPTLERLTEAETMCSKASKEAESKFTQASEKGKGKGKGVMRMISFRSLFAHPWAENTISGDWDAEQIEALVEWRRVVGMHAFVYLFRAVALFGKRSNISGAFALRSAWLLARHAPNSPIENDEPQFAQMVKGVFLLMLSNLPPFLQKVFSVIGFQSDREAGLELLKNAKASREYEPSTFGTIVFALHHLMLSQQEYNSDIREHMNQAQAIMEEELRIEPKSVLAKLVFSHIVRRQGQLKLAMDLLDEITPKVIGEVTAFDDLDCHAYRMEFDRAMLHFVNFNFDEAIKLLDPLVVEESSFGAKVLATAVVISCLALKDEQDTERIEKLTDEMHSGSDQGRMDQSILLKQKALKARNHKDLLGFEILYIFGHMKCYSPVLGVDPENNKKWLQERRAELLQLSEETEIVEPEDVNKAIKDAHHVDAEEYLAAMLICGHISGLLGELDKAGGFLAPLAESRTVYETVSQSGDSYAVPWAMYELAAIKMREGPQQDWKKAKALLEKADKLAKSQKVQFSFSHMLSFKCQGGIRECKKHL